MNTSKFVFFVPAVAASLYGCGDHRASSDAAPSASATAQPEPSVSTPSTPDTPAATPKFAPALGVDLAAMTKTPSGLAYRDVKVGTGPVATAGHVGVRAVHGLAPRRQQVRQQPRSKRAVRVSTRRRSGNPGLGRRRSRHARRRSPSAGDPAEPRLRSRRHWSDPPQLHARVRRRAT